VAAVCGDLRESLHRQAIVAIGSVRTLTIGRKLTPGIVVTFLRTAIYDNRRLSDQKDRLLI